MDPETRDAIGRLGVDLRGEIRSSEAETRTYVGARIQASAAETRRHLDVGAESLRGDIRGLAEVIALSNERTERRFGEPTGRTEGLEGRVLRLEARVSILEDDREPPRRRRRR